MTIDNISSLTEQELREIWEYLTPQEKEQLTKSLSLTALPPQKCGLFDRNSNPVDWLESHFYIPETNSPIILSPYQRAAFSKALEKDEKGLFKYSLVVWSDRKKSGKTTISAGFAAWLAFTQVDPFSQIIFVGNKLQQAKSRAFFYFTRMLKLNPECKKLIAEGKIVINKYDVFLPNDIAINSVPSSPSGEAGSNPSAVIWTEIGLAATDSAKLLWSDLAPPPGKLGKAIRWAEGYAGVKGRSVILEPLYEALVKPEYRMKTKEGYPFYESGRTFTLWNSGADGFYTPWQTKEYYDQQRKELSPSEFDRVHNNVFSAGTSEFVPEIWWTQLKEELPELDEKEKIILGIDAAVSDDCFAIVGVTKHPTNPGKLAVRLVRIWEPGKDGKIYFKNPTEDKERDSLYPWGYISDLSKKYKVIMAVYDPYQLEHFAQQQNSERICYWKPFTQGEKRLKADKHLYDLIVSRQLVHDGNKHLAEHITNADSRIDTSGAFRIVKRSIGAKIDAAVALSMAAFEARQLRL